MASIEQIVKTPYGAAPILFLKCDQCSGLSTEQAALGWLQVGNLGPVIATLGGSSDLSGDYCSPACLMKTMVEQGITMEQITAACGESATQGSEHDQNGQD